MPALSPTMLQGILYIKITKKKGNIGTWHKSIGDELTPGDVLVEIETDKAQMDMECQDEGFLAKVFIQSGAKDVAVNTPICVLVDDKADIAAFDNFTPPSTDAPAAAPAPESTSSAPAPATTTSTPAPQTQSTAARIFASPLAKSLAAQNGIDLGAISGSGPGGRVVKNDVLNFKPASSAFTPSAPAPPTATANFVDIPLTNIRKVIASRLAESKSTIPHYYMTQEIDVSKVLKLRESLNKESNGKYKLSINDFVIKASSLSLLDIPALNSSFQGSFIREYKNADICVAVATDTGLLTPIVTAAETKGLSTISNTVKTLAERGRAGKLQPHEYQGGTFTISNLGMYGISHFTAIINPPHAAILAVGGVTDKLVLDSSNAQGFRATKVMNVTLSPDHRVVDGAVAAEWLNKFKSYLENPLTMLL
ncbi:pyruvate dehydrogenase complex dihydrolipoamide acetyltransferase component (E2) [Globomyces sp. JEL0801]|nr:pyruvate dehydrogenase complex dihydrolipoamide acetyltransferase component (E2) [Globomyces sp. JEL0801]